MGARVPPHLPPGSPYCPFAAVQLLPSRIVHPCYSCGEDPPKLMEDMVIQNCLVSFDIVENQFEPMITGKALVDDLAEGRQSICGEQ